MAKKVNLNNVTELRTAVDEGLPLVFYQLGYAQSFFLEDLKLGLGLTTVAIAAFLFYLEKKTSLSFQDSYYIIMALVAVYGVVSLVMYYFANSGQYKDNKYIGFNEKKQKVALFALTKPFDPVYNVKVVLDDNFDGAVQESIPFSKMFDVFGFYNHDASKEIFKRILEKKQE